jgi:LPS-assembly protein
MHHPRNKACVARFALSPVALVAATLLQPAAAQAQAQVPAPAPAASEAAPRLRPTPLLREDIPAPARGQLPTFVEGDQVRGRPDLETIVEGNAELRRGDTIIRAQRIEYHQPDDLARATGNVRINKAGNIFEGPLLELKLDSFEGFFNEPRYRFIRNDAYGEAERIDFTDEKHAVVRKATYTTCQRKPGPGWMPDWILRASSISLDQEEDVGVARGAVLSFMGVPILPVPSLSFPLGDARKSGFLPPTIGLDNRSGFELTVPYYWNIAPNRDATLYPTLMTKRGVDLGAEFRYLEPTYGGTTRANFLPNDRLRSTNRWGFSAWHTHRDLPIPFLGTNLFNLNLNRVSDNDYWRDFSRNSSSLTQRLLTNEGTLAWSWADVSMTARMLRWQTLQDLTSPIIPPYNRSPQFTARQTRANLWGGFETNVEADYTHFTHTVSDELRQFFRTNPLTEITQPNGHRAFAQVQVSRPFQAPGWFVVPKGQLHTRTYRFDSPTLSGERSASVTVPTFSVDSGLLFERPTTLFGRDFLQTLEPRAFYVYTPFRDQSRLPNYDSAVNDFNFATVFTENEFVGHDRISDSHLVTVGASTRLLDANTGAEAARFAVAQRLRLRDQRVNLPGTTPVSERLSDTLFGVSIALFPKWSADATLQFNPKTHRTIRETVGLRYSPGNYRVVSAAYRVQRGLSEQVDIGWQWPLNDLWGDRGRDLGPGQGLGEGRWYSVGRLNFSLNDITSSRPRLVEGLLGLEYDAGCWLGRIVVERLQAGINSSNKRILFQLEFVGFSRLGSNALQALKDNIPRYQYLRERTTAPSRFSNYD